jgi:EF hand
MKISRSLGLLFLSGGFAWLAAKESPDPAPAPAKPPTDFKSLDTDGDGRISLAEFTAPAEKLREARRAKGKAQSKEGAGDATRDGILSPADSVEGRYSPEVFKQLDINHDNFVSPAELEALFTNAHNISQP